MLDKIGFYYFSPTGGTKKAGEIFCQGIAETVREVNLGAQNRETEEAKEEWIAVAAPVFGGRIPAFVTEKLKKLHGEGKKAVTLAVYGNRDYDDALLELNRVMKAQGFQITASAALIAQHSIVPEVGQGRPDSKDQEEILDFGRKVLEKIETAVDSPVKVPGNYPYKEAMAVPAAPISLPSCNQCGTCAKVCPTEAISIEGTEVMTDGENCMMCMACTAACPQGARILPPPVKERTEKMLGALKNVRRENELFL